MPRYKVRNLATGTLKTKQFYLTCGEEIEVQAITPEIKSLKERNLIGYVIIPDPVSEGKVLTSSEKMMVDQEHAEPWKRPEYRTKKQNK